MTAGTAGDATLFITGPAAATMQNAGCKLLNNHDFRCPGSDHGGIVNFGYADGSVHAISDFIDSDVFALLGSMADRQPMPTPP